MLKTGYHITQVEAGCDEAGRGCLAGPVFAAAVILPKRYKNAELNDSKKLNHTTRNALRTIIERDALATAVIAVHPEEIDRINILRASIRAMHRAIDALSIRPDHLLIDGNFFEPYPGIPHTTVIRGDGIYAAIAAASILAKTYRDDYMEEMHARYPEYGWDHNKGYPTEAHRKAIFDLGPTPIHRQSFRLLPDPEQLSLFED
ncbi:MAG: ribonuclease HII [Lewinellaceae bacterium]|nr:ribonuclease HII [Lewinellaceae bacterium]